MQRTWGVIVWVTSLAAGLLFLAGWLWMHRDYYWAPIEEQALHLRHDQLRSSGGVGLPLGIAGLLLFLVNLGYLIRRRVEARWLGSLRSWMALHVTSGLLGGGCVLLHSTLSIRSASGGVAAAALGIVILTGIIGRYLYSLLPRTIEGRVEELERAQTRFEQLCLSLQDRGVTLDLQPEVVPDHNGRSSLAALPALVLGDPQVRREHRAVWQKVKRLSLEPGGGVATRRLVRQLLRQRTTLNRYHELRRLMASWRFLHRWLALVMLGAIAFHVLVALRFGSLG